MALWPRTKTDMTEPPASTTQPSADQSKAERDEFIAQMKTSFEEIVKPIREKVDSFDQTFETLRQAAAQASRPPDNREPADPLSDPDRWKAENLGPLAMQTALLRAEVTEEKVLRTIPDEWRDVVEPQVRDLLSKNTPPAEKVKPGYSEYIGRCIDLVIGQEARKAGLRRDPANKRFFIEDAASGKSGSGPSGLPSDFGYTDERGRYHSPNETLAKLGIDEGEFLKGAS